MFLVQGYMGWLFFALYYEFFKQVEVLVV